MGMGYPPGGPTGPRQTGSTLGQSLDLDGSQRKSVGKHGSSRVASTDGKSHVGRGKASGDARIPKRSIHERSTRAYEDSLDSAGFDSLDEDEGFDEQLDKQLDKQLDEEFSKRHSDSYSKKSAPTRYDNDEEDEGIEEDLNKQLKRRHSEVDSEQPVPAAKRNVEITSTQEVNGDSDVDAEKEIEAGLKKELSFLDKIPYKKYLTGGTLGVIFFIGGALTLPFGAGAYALGLTLMVMSAAYIYADDGSSGAPPPPPVDSKKKQDDENGKSSGSPEDSLPKNDLIAVENPDFRKAEESTLTEDEALRKIKEKFLRGEQLDPQEIAMAQEQLLNGNDPLSQQVSKLLAPLLKEAGFDHKNSQSWKAVSGVVNAVKKAALNPEIDDKELADGMEQATRELLKHLPKLDDKKLRKYRSSAVAFMNSSGLPNRARTVFKAHIEAIDEYLRQHGSQNKRTPPPIAKKPAKFQEKTKGNAANIEGERPAQRLDLLYDKPEGIDNITNRNHFSILRFELMGKLDEQGVENILAEAYRILSSTDNVASGKGFIQDLIALPQLAAYQTVISEVIRVQSRFRD